MCVDVCVRVVMCVRVWVPSRGARRAGLFAPAATGPAPAPPPVLERDRDVFLFFDRFLGLRDNCGW